MKKITDPDFKYTPSYDTDLRKKFKRMEQEHRKRAEQARLEAKAEAERNRQEQEQKVAPLAGRRKTLAP